MRRRLLDPRILLALTPTPALAAGDAVPSLAAVAMRTGLALAAVLAAIAGLAYLLRRLRFSPRNQRTDARLASIARLDLGLRREIRIIEVADQVLVVGVTADRIDLLTELDTAAKVRQPELQVLRELTTSS
ncbi:MAG: flagellar biosynthetic protein FliO [Candidatus Eiseniibacteriota bacterium]